MVISLPYNWRRIGQMWNPKERVNMKQKRNEDGPSFDSKELLTNASIYALIEPQ